VRLLQPTTRILAAVAAAAAAGTAADAGRYIIRAIRR